MSEKVEIIAELKDLVTGKFADMNRQVDALDSKLSALDSHGDRGGIMGQVLGANLLTNAVQTAGRAIIEFGKESFYAYGHAEQFQVALKTLLHGNGELAGALNNQLKAFALETPFELTEIQAATKMMIAYGSKAGNVVDEMRMLGDVSSGVGSTLSEVAYLYGTLRTQGRSFSKDIFQFTGRGIPIVKELAKQFHVTDDKVMKLVEDGKVGFRQIELAFQSMTKEGGQFFGMMNDQSKTVLGQKSNLSDAWSQLQQAIGESQSGILKSTILWATQMVTVLKKAQEQVNFTTGIEQKIHQHGISGQWAPDKRDFRYLDANGNLTDKEGERVNNYNVESTPEAMRKSGGKPFQRADGTYTSESHEYRRNKLMNAGDQVRMLNQQVFEGTKSINKENAPTLENSIKSQLIQLKRESDQGLISDKLFISKAAILQEGLEKIRGFIALQADKDDPKKPAKDQAKEPAKLEEAAKHNKANQIIINIENLVREYTNKFMNGESDDAKNMTAQKISQVFLGLLNDASMIAQR